MAVLLFSLVFLVVMLIDTPIAFAMGAASLAGVLAQGRLNLSLVPERVFTGTDSFVLLAIPLFILAGALMDTGGISLRLVNLSRALIGHVRGGLGMVVVVAEMFFSGISGSTVADVSAISAMLLPSMRRSGYSSEYAISIVSAASAMGILIPPCILMVVLGGIMNVSVSALFVGGIVPALVLALLLLALLSYQARRLDLPAERRATAGELARAGLDALIPLGMPVIIFGGILGGIFTPTEAAAVAVLYALVVGLFVYRELSPADLPRLCLESGLATGTIMFLIGLSTIFSFLLAIQNVPELVRDTILGISTSPLFFLLVANVVFIVGGAFLEGLPAAVIFVPIFMPVVRQLGIDPLHFGILVVAAVGLGLFIPPVGVGLMVGCAVEKIDVHRTFRPMLPFIGVLSLGLLVLTLVPWLTTILPRLLLPNVR